MEDRVEKYDNEIDLDLINEIHGKGWNKTDYCHYEIILNAYHKKYKNIIIFENDIQLEDYDETEFKNALNSLDNHDWSMFFLGGTPHNVKEVHPHLLKVNMCQVHAYAINGKYFKDILIELSKNKIKYERQTLGSFKYKTPNEYETGYLMVKHLNNSYGNDVFNEIVKKANRQSFLPMPFFRALKKETGLNYNQLYFDAISSLPQKELIEKKEPINLRVNNSYSSFLYPREINSERFVALREGYGSYQDFRIIDNKGNVSLLFTPGLINDFGRIPYSNNMIAWLEFDKDPRWDKRVFSSLKILELSAKKIINKPLKGFFSSADLSPDGKRVLVAVNNLDGSQGFEEYEMKTMTKMRRK